MAAARAALAIARRGAGFEVSTRNIASVYAAPLGHERRLQNDVVKTLKLLKELQKEPPQEEDFSEVVETESGFVPHTEFAVSAARH